MKFVSFESSSHIFRFKLFYFDVTVMGKNVENLISYSKQINLRQQYDDTVLIKEVKFTKLYDNTVIRLQLNNLNKMVIKIGIILFYISEI